MSPLLGLLTVEGYIAAMAAVLWAVGRRDPHEGAATRRLRSFRDRP